MPRGIPKNKPNGISKMEGMRRALAKLGGDAQNKDIHKLLKSQFSIDMDTKMISNYKTHLKAAGKRVAIHQPAISPAAPLAKHGITLEDIRAVKEAVNKIGADKVRQLAAVLGE